MRVSEPAWWRTLATVVGRSSVGIILIRINGWDLSRPPTEVTVTQLPPSLSRCPLGTNLLVWVSERADGVLLLRDFAPADGALPGSELAV